MFNNKLEKPTPPVVLEIVTEYGIEGYTDRVCQGAAQRCLKFARSPIGMQVTMVDFGGNVIGEFIKEREA